jgi:hypothetical protein
VLKEYNLVVLRIGLAFYKVIYFAKYSGFYKRSYYALILEGKEVFAV